MPDIPIDLTTVTEVSVLGAPHRIVRGTFVIGRALFTMRDENGNDVTHYGGNMHPPSYAFTRADGARMAGIYDAISSFIHDTQPPEPEEPEPKHELLKIGTRVLVSDWARPLGSEDLKLMNPQAGRISGYAAGNSKYKWQREYEPGHYSTHESWAFADNRVEVHPDGPECPPPSRQEPTEDRRVYVERKGGAQGYLIGAKRNEAGRRKVRVHWLTAGGPETWVFINDVEIITGDEVQRCENGQDGEECGSGENQCELCLAAEDAEAEAIEKSMGV